jgi:predicted ATPase
MWRAFGVFLEGFATLQSGPAGGGLAEMRRGAELLREQNTLIFDGLLMTPLAEAEGRAGDVDRALAILDEALERSERIGHRAFEAELHRSRGEMLLKRDRASTASAEQALRRAIAVAHKQGTGSFGLRAALALAKLYQSTGRLVDADAVLSPALEGFTPTAEMPEIAEAQALLVALDSRYGPETERIGAFRRSRRRRTAALRRGHAGGPDRLPLLAGKAISCS